MYVAYNCRIARPGFYLLAVSQRNTILGGTEVDEVVSRGKTCNLTSFRVCLAIVRQPRLNLTTIED